MGNTNVKPHPKPRSKKPLRWKAADRPSTPGKPSLIGESGSIPDVVHIGWTIPEKDGSSTVTSYSVEHRRVGTTHWLKASSQPVTTNELQVHGLEPGWRYQFRVRAQNAVGLSDYSEASEPYTVTLQRTAIAAPKFTQELKDTVVLEDDKVNFEIHFLGQPPPNICWFKDGFEIFSGNRTRVYTAADKSVLTILQATAADEGEIKCTATNKAGHASTKSKLTIEAPPSIKLPRSYQDQDGIIFEIGETIKLNVTVNGRPLPLIFWSHDGESIQNDDRYEIEYNDKIATLKIENALRSDRGEYQVKAVNKLGQDQASFLVTITDKPTPPGKARVLLTSGKSVTLGWSTPKDDGGSKIGNYIIEYYRMGWDVWLKAATTRQHSTMLGDLIEGSTYKFRVKAESPYGVSEPSEESEVVVIPGIKRNQITNVDRRNDSDSRIPLSQRRRANSTPRVSFILNADVPVRPERKKTGKTPEASPRMRRKQLNPLSKNNLGSEPFLNRKFSPVSVAQTNTTYRNSPQGSWNNSQVTNFQENSFKRTPTTTIIKVEKHKSPSPEIIITDADLESQKRSQEKSPSRSPNFNAPSRSTTSTEDSPFKSVKPTDESYSKAVNNLEVSLPRNPEISRKSSSRSPSGSPNSPEKSPLRGLYYPENSKSRSPSSAETSPPIYQEKSPSRSPNHFQMSPIEKSPPRSPTRISSSPTDNIHERSPVNPEYSKKPSPSSPTRDFVKKEYSSPNNTQLTEHYNPQSQSNVDRMKPSLTRQQFSGSSEFMLVLCPEGEQGTQFRKFGISFEENSIPPPLSLSAPELGFEPPDSLPLKRSASSTELLTYRLMERLHEEVMSENDAVREVNMDSNHSAIPTIQVNSEPAREVREENPILSRRSSWSKRRYSLKNAKDMSGDFGPKLRKFEETDAMRREVSEYRRISESEEVGDKDVKSLDDDDWMRDYEESVSEEESLTSSQDERPFSKMNPNNDFENDDEEIYNPRSRMMSAVKTDDNQPFEILTVRKNPPNSNIIPKPILKKTTTVGKEDKTINSKTNKQSLIFEAKTMSDDKRNQIPKRNRSTSLSEALEDEMNVDQLKTSSKPIKRRSFSLIPTQANLIKDALKARDTKNVTETSRNEPAKNVSALASFTSIAGAGFILPNEMKEKKETEEEAKVVVDFYGDIVKNFGGKSKPTAEFSRSMASKYDTYEERKISDIKPNADSLAPHPPASPRKPEFSSVDPWNHHSQEKVFSNAKPSSMPSNLSRPKQDEIISNQPAYGRTSPHDPHSYKFPSTPQEQAKLKEEFNRLVNMNKVDIPEPKSRVEVDESFRQMRTELSESRTSQKSTNRDLELERSNVRPLSNLERKRRGRSRSGRSGTRSGSIIGRRKQTPMSRDASTSPVRFSDDWDSQCSSRNSLEHDYYNRGSLTSSRASSLSRRSLSPPKPRVRGITTQTSFRIEAISSHDVQKREDLVKKAEDRMSFVFGYLTDAAMVGVAAWLFIFQSEYLAVPFIVIPIYRQLDQKVKNMREGIKNMKEGIKKKLPRWIRKRFEGES